MEIESDIQQVVAYLTRELNELERAQAVKRGLTDATKVFVARGRLNLAARLKPDTRGKGNLMRAFRTAFDRRSTTAYAGFREKRGRSRYSYTSAEAQSGAGAPHAHLVDLGSGPRFTKRDHIYRGIMPANYFWRDARISEEENAYDAIYRGVREVVSKIQAKAR